MNRDSSDQLETVLDRARTLGFLGPGPIRVHIEHAEHYLKSLPDEINRITDLGSGGGLPGLPLAMDLTSVHFRLLDASEKRCDFLEWAVDQLGLKGRVSVVLGRAEQVGHDPVHRAWADAVVSRSFAAPHHTVECAMALTQVGGSILISEPPGGRCWPVADMASLGLQVFESTPHLVHLKLIRPPPDHTPRRFKKQDRHPLFSMPATKV